MLQCCCCCFLSISPLLTMLSILEVNVIVVANHLLLHDRAGTLASYLLLYKGEKPFVYLSVCRHFFRHALCSSAWFQRGSTPNILDMKRPSLQVTISLFKRF